MNSVQQFRDAQTLRQQKNLTTAQKRTNADTVEGVVVNNLVRPENNIHEIYDTLIISKNLKYPTQLTNNSSYEEQNSALKRLSLVTTAFFAATTAATFLISFAAKRKAKLPSWKTLPEVPRNIALNEETHFATYAMIQNPTRKTILGALGVFSLTAFGAVGKNFVDGFKEIWVKKQEAKVQRDLQENLIEVETQTFSGKMQIQRTMLSENAKMLEKYLNPENKIQSINPTFKNFISFKRDKKEEKYNNSKNDLLLGTFITLAMGGLSYISLKNIQKTAKYYDNYAQKMQNQIKDMISNNKSTDSSTLETIKKIMVSLQAKKKFISETLENLPLNNDEKTRYIDSVINEVEKITQDAAEAIAGKPGWKASFYSHVNDVRGHFYNWIVNFDNSILGTLFAAISGVSVAGYVGKQALEGIKQAEVIKTNAQTELDLQRKLVDVELKNFYAKKSSVINPLINEFLVQAKHGKNPVELKTMAENILLEIKNGPPFVYS